MRRLIPLAAVAALTIGAAPATAKKQPPSSFTVGDAAVLGPVHVTGRTARIHVRYACTVGTHLWVSAKQSASGAVDPKIAEDGSGFGGTAAAWWQSHRGSFTCDGRRHVQWFTVDTVEPGSRGQLRRGSAWVQFCLTTDDALDAVRMQWSGVVVNG